MPYAYVVLEFRGGFTSYSPVLHEGYLDSTTLQAALVAVEAELLGHSKPLLADARFTSLLPLACVQERSLPLLPPLRLPVAGSVSGFWTPRAANKALKAIADCSGDVVLVYDADRGVHHFYCLTNGNVFGNLVYSPDRMLVAAEGEKVEFQPPLVTMDRHRLVVDRLTATATPYMLAVVEPRTPYWFAAHLPANEHCHALREALRLIEHVGLGAYRSVGFGRVRVVEARCGSLDLLPDELLGVDAHRPGLLVSLGLLLPKSGCRIMYCRASRFGAYRGYGGRILNFRRPMVVAAAPGSIVEAGCSGRVESSADSPTPYVYSFNPLFYPVASR